MLASDLAMALDPVQLAIKAGTEPDPWQAQVLRSTSDRLLLNCSRQAGKSTTTGVLATHTAVYEPDSLVLLLSPSLRQSQELFRKVIVAYRALGRPVRPEAESSLRLELENGSRIISAPGKEGTIRGFSKVRLLIIDEAARVPDELYFGVRPMLAVSGGRLLALSTPWGKRGWWYDAWRGDAPWERYEVPATECPLISPEFLDEERQTLGEFWYAQEYMCQFMDARGAAFRREDIDRTFEEGVEAWAL